MAEGRRTLQFDLGPQAVTPSELFPGTADGEVLQTQSGQVVWGAIPPNPGDFELAKRYAFFVS